MTKIIAISGKGGVGKTSISALIVKTLIKDPNKRILAIDGDPAVGFSTALGIEVSKTLDDIRNNVIQDAKIGDKATRTSLLQRVDYEILDALVESNGFAFLAIGRPEGKGCYCKINDYLKSIIAELSPSFDYIIIDGEAGIEQIHRRVMEKVTHLLMVSDASKKGINVAKTVHKVAKNAMEFEKAGLLFNRLKSASEVKETDFTSLDCIGYLFENEEIRNADINGTSILNLPDDEMSNYFEKIIMNFLN